MDIMRKSLFAASMLALSVAVAPACATKKFVKTEVGTVNTKVDTLSGTVEETQERTRRNEERIGSVDQKADAAGKAGQGAQASGGTAISMAKDVDNRVQQTNQRVDAVETASKRLIYTVTLSEDQGNFKFGKADLPDTAKARIDEVINQLKTNPQNVYIEIEGHTDNVGNKRLNDEIGMER